MTRPLILISTLLVTIGLVATTGAVNPAAADLGDIVTTPTVTVETPIITVETPPVTVPDPIPTDPDPTPTEPAPTPTDPAPTPTDPAPTPTDPAPTPTDPTPTPTQPAPTPTEPAVVPPAATNPVPTPTPPGFPAPTTAAGAAAAPVVTFGPAGTPLNPSPTSAPGSATGAGRANQTAIGLGDLWSQFPLGTAAITAPLAMTWVPDVTAAAGTSRSAVVPVTVTPAPEQPSLMVPAAFASHSVPGASMWPVLLLGALVLAALLALTIGRDAARTLLGGIAARRRNPIGPALVGALPARRARVVTDPPALPIARLEQCDLRWRRGFLRARFEAVAITPGGETRIGTSDRYWGLRDRRTAGSVAAYALLLQTLRQLGWHEAPATSLWYRAASLSPGGRWYERRLERALPGRRSAVAQLDHRDADVAVSRAG
jgi:outer membrane biosynthesis protein TonB